MGREGAGGVLYTNCFPFVLWLVELLCYAAYDYDYDIGIKFWRGVALCRGDQRNSKGVTGWDCLEFSSNTCSN